MPRQLFKNSGQLEVKVAAAAAKWNELFSRQQFFNEQKEDNYDLEEKRRSSKWVNLCTMTEWGEVNV